MGTKNHRHSLLSHQMPQHLTPRFPRSSYPSSPLPLPLALPHGAYGAGAISWGPRVEPCIPGPRSPPGSPCPDLSKGGSLGHDSESPWSSTSSRLVAQPRSTRGAWLREGLGRVNGALLPSWRPLPRYV